MKELQCAIDELWNDISFIEKRIEEQRVYILELNVRLELEEIDAQRAYALAESAKAVADRFIKRKRELYGWDN